MRPHHLTVQAFGPFPDVVEVDLDRLSGGGLFLLHGDTGSGKTTLLDALGFALYGRVPGVRNKVGRLRADLADPSVRTRVELTVTLGGRLLRITRHPAQEQPKRGGGTRTVNASVVLEEDRGSGWDTLSTRNDEAGAELDALLGMSADQFFQVVLLPQGEFATFLRAPSDKRREVLQRLFGTKRFEDIENWLKERRTLLAGQVSDGSAGLERLRHRVAQAAGVELPGSVAPASPAPLGREAASDDPLAEPSTDQLAGPVPPRVLSEVPSEVPRAGPSASGDVTGWVTGLVEAAEQDVDAAARKVRRVQGLRDTARADKDAADRLADRQRRRRSAADRQAALSAQADALTAVQLELAAAERAAGLGNSLAAVDERTGEQAAAVAAESQLRARLPAVGLSTDLPPTELDTAADEAGKRLVRLDGLADVATERSDAVSARAAVRVESDAAESALSEALMRLAALPERRDRVAEQLAAARAAQERLPAVRARLAVLMNACQEAAGLARTRAELTGLRERRLTAGEHQLALRTQAEQLREQRFTSIFGELSRALEDGAPCEVCGATEHPDPYLGDADEVTREQAEAAQVEAEQARGVFDRLTTNVEVTEATAAGHERRLSAADVGELADLSNVLATAEQERDRLAALGSTRDDHERALETITTEQGELDRSRLLAETTLAALRPREVELAQRVEKLTARLAGELGQEPDLAAAQERAACLEQVCDAVAEAFGASARATKELDRARQQLVRQSTAAGFQDAEQAAAALRDDAWRETALRRVQDHAEQVAAVREQLAGPELDVVLDPPADTAAAAALVAEHDLALQEAVREASLAERRHTDLTVLLPEVTRAERELGPLVARAAEVKAIAELCSGAGANTLKMTLTSFVLAARLEEVAAAASVPLLKMTQGRYSLVHSDGAVKGGARSGLELLARDSWTGEDRPVSTLSGGETFQASLALALGLAEVVQAEAGGARLDALFVDEGFGSLDEVTLDEVMDVLDGLREGGRVVGVVSHVAELRARIPAQVRVTKGRGGSTLTLAGC